MKKVLLVVKTGKRKMPIINNGLDRKRGSELAQTVLITAIMIMIIAALFFPQIKTLFESAMAQITTWFNSILADISWPKGVKGASWKVLKK